MKRAIRAKIKTMYLTKEGLEKLKEELKQLIEVSREEVAKKIQIAREMGDLSENSLYDAAKEEQAFIEGRIAELEDIIKNSKVSSAKASGEIAVGSKVTVHIEGDEETYHLVGAPEADPLARKISHESPIGSALMGKKVGDKVKVEAPMGSLTYTILKVE